MLDRKKTNKYIMLDRKETNTQRNKQTSKHKKK